MAEVRTEIDLFDAWYRIADVDKDGRVGGGEAVPFLQRSGLSKEAFEDWSLHCLPMRHIVQLLRTHGLELLEVVEDGQTGGLHNRFHSHTFFAVKR